MFIVLVSHYDRNTAGVISYGAIRRLEAGSCPLAIQGTVALDLSRQRRSSEMYPANGIVFVAANKRSTWNAKTARY